MTDQQAAFQPKSTFSSSAATISTLSQEGEGSEAPPKLTTTTEEPFSKENQVASGQIEMVTTALKAGGAGGILFREWETAKAADDRGEGDHH